MRTCIICLPRTGSQWCEKLIASAHTPTFQLSEYFENWNHSTYGTIEGVAYLKEFAFKAEQFGINKYESRLTDLKTFTNEHMVLRLFLMNNYDKVQLSFIINELSTLGFGFIALTRNIEDQLLSYIIARSQPTNVFAINSNIVDKVTVNIRALEPVIAHISNSSHHWDMNINSVFKDKAAIIDHVRYETLNADLDLIYGKKLIYEGHKSVRVDHLALINNSQEVAILLKKYGNRHDFG